MNGPYAVILELMAEISYPRRCEFALCSMYAGCELSGGIFIIVVISCVGPSSSLLLTRWQMGYMKDSQGTLQPAIYLQCGLALLACGLFMSLGWFGRAGAVKLRRREAAILAIEESSRLGGV